MKRTTLAFALVTLAGTAAAQPAYFPGANSSPLTPPSVQAGTVITASGLPFAGGAPSGASRGAIDQVAPPLTAGSAALPGTGEEPTTERGDNPGQGGVPSQNPPGLAVATTAVPAPAVAPVPGAPPPGAPPPAGPQSAGNAPGSENAVRLILADGYKSPQGVTRGPDGRWHGKAMRGTALVDVSVDSRGNVSSP
ncbi:MAG: hypothetical protein JOY64_32090 [Alphaproteobacteria bacterium]|nr:hypothetical protein [Alphaproteobacteria bacterium]